MNFQLPVVIGDQVSCYCKTTRICRTTIAVHIETWVRRKHQQQEYLKVTEATYTYVSIDEQRKPVPVELIE